MRRPFRLILIGLAVSSAASAARSDSAHLSPGTLSTSAARYQLGAGELDGAIASMAVALAEEERAHGGDSLQVATALSRLALLHTARTVDAPKAQTLYEHALRIRERRLGPNHLGVAKSLENLARVHFALATWCCDPNAPPNPHASIARALLRQALRIRVARLGFYHPDNADEAYNLATSPDNTPRIDVQPLYERALAVREKAFGPDSLPTAESLLELAYMKERSNEIWTLRQRTDRCKTNQDVAALRRRALAIQERLLGPDAPELKRVLHSLAPDDCAESASPGQGLAVQKRILAIDEKANGPDSMTVADDLENLASLLNSPEQAAEKRATELRVNRIREAHLATDEAAAKSRRCLAQSRGEEFDRLQLISKFDAQADLAKIEIVDDSILNAASDHQDLRSLLECRPFSVALIAQTYERLGDSVSAERVRRSHANSLPAKATR